MFIAPPSPWLVPFDGDFDLAALPTRDPERAGAKREGKALDKAVARLADQQKALYAHDRWGVVLVFQAMDAAGKDSTIRAVLSGVNPAGCRVTSFKAPSSRELDADFLWRVQAALPARGTIGVFNRSHYEEVLVVRVHPEYLGGQRLPFGAPGPDFWRGRVQSIVDWERHLASNGFAILKFFLNVSPDEQARRQIRRIDRADKQWKFNPGDLDERALWPAYMEAYQDALASTSRSWAPWYAIPADDKPTMRRTVADLVVQALDGLDVAAPAPSPKILAQLDACRARLVAELPAE